MRTWWPCSGLSPASIYPAAPLQSASFGDSHVRGKRGQQQAAGTRCAPVTERTKEGHLEPITPSCLTFFFYFKRSPIGRECVVLCSSKKNTASLRVPATRRGILSASYGTRLTASHPGILCPLHLDPRPTLKRFIRRCYVQYLGDLLCLLLVLGFTSTVTYFPLPSLAWLGKEARLEV